MTLLLVWPGTGQGEASIRTLLSDVADEVVVTSWDPAAEDGGRSALLTSLRDAREHAVAQGSDPDTLTLVGFGHGAVAAAGIARYAKRLGIGLGRVIAVAGTWDEPDPFSGSPVKAIPERVELVEKADAYLLATTLRRT